MKIISTLDLERVSMHVIRSTSLQQVVTTDHNEQAYNLSDNSNIEHQALRIHTMRAITARPLGSGVSCASSTASGD